MVLEKQLQVLQSFLHAAGTENGPGCVFKASKPTISDIHPPKFTHPNPSNSFKQYHSLVSKHSIIWHFGHGAIYNQTTKVPMS